MRMHSFALALATVIVAVPAAAAEEQAPRIGVHYNDLDLTTEAGQKQLDLRLERAAREVCGVNERVIGSYLPSRHSVECYREARRNIDREFAQLVSRKNAARGG